MKDRDVVIVGGGAAGVKTAHMLRERGYTGRVVLVCDEDHVGYDRPPLSKQVLTGQWTPDRLTANLDVDADVLPATRAVKLSLDTRTVTLHTGDELHFDQLVIATGTRARRLPLCDVRRVHVVRSLTDATSLLADLDKSPNRVAVVGGGFIGAEVASSCRQRGLPVTLIEPAPFPLVRAVGSTVGRCLAEHYSDHGVDVRLGISVAGWTVDAGGGLTGLDLSDGSSVACDVAVVAIGAQPNTEWLHGSGLSLEDGVVCDKDLIAAPGVLAVGDIARWPNASTKQFRRIEHWDNAGRQASHAAATLLDSPRPEHGYMPVPWVWSDQFDRKIQIYGSTDGHDEVLISAGTLSERKFVALYRRGDHLSAALSVNMARPLLAYRRLFERGDVAWTEVLDLAAHS